MAEKLLLVEFGMALVLAGLIYKVVERIKKRRNKGRPKRQAHWI